jgi:hypothetical protein
LFVCSAVDWTSVLAHARQVLFHGATYPDLPQAFQGNFVKTVIQFKLQFICHFEQCWLAHNFKTTDSSFNIYSVYSSPNKSTMFVTLVLLYWINSYLLDQQSPETYSSLFRENCNVGNRIENHSLSDYKEYNISTMLQ